MKIILSYVLLFCLITQTTFAASYGTSLGDGGGGISSSEKGQPNGVATLDGTGKVPLAQIPGGGGSGVWGSITGTLGDQTDLATALGLKQDALSFTAPIVNTLNVVSMAVATNVANGYLSSADWITFNGKQNALGFTPEDVANKSIDGTLAANSDTLYPSQKAVKTYADTKQAALGFTPEDVANKDTDNTLAADSDTKYASQKAVKAYVTNSISTSAATKWGVAGNTGLSGGKLGTTDANNWDLIAGNSTIATVVESYKGISAAPTIVPADATGVNQFDWRTYVSPTASTTGANHVNNYSQLIWDNPNAGFNNASGSLIASSSAFNHNGSGTINYASTNTNSANFDNAGTTTQFKGVTSENGIASGTTVSDYNGLVSGLNTTGGIVPASNSISTYGNFTNATIGNAMSLSSSLAFSGTTANSQGVNGVSTFIQFNDSTTTTNGVNGLSSGIDVNNTAALNGINGSNVYINMRDTATHGGLNLNSVGLNQEDSAVNTGGVNGFNANLQFSNTSDTAGVNIFNGYVNTVDTAHLDSLTGINLNPEIQGSSDVDNITMGSFSGQIRGSSTVDNLTGVTVNPQMSGSAAVTNFTGLNVSPQVNGTSVLTNALTGIQLSPSSAADISGVKGIDINMSGVTLSAAAIAAGEHKTALSTDGAISAGYGYTVPGAATFFQQHYLGGTANVANGAPVSAFGFGTNLAQTVTLHDDWTIDASGLGYVDVGFVGALNFDTGTTMARWTGALGGAGNPGGAGTLTDAIMFRAAGILPQGGTLTVTNAYGFQVDPNLFGLTGTNVWGFYEDTSNADNHLSKLAIGTTSKKVTNSSTALEIGNSKGFINGSGSTATKNALTAVAGMQFYDTTLNELQWYDGASWVPAMGGSGAVTSVNSLTGAVVLDTDDISEGATNLYYTDARAIAAPLTGYTSGAGTVAATDTILQGIQKLNGNIAGKQAAFTDIQELATGTVDNSNVTFTLSQTPSSNASVELFLGGLILYQGTEYTISGSTITMTTAPNFGQTLYAKYRY